jgi:alkylresorcinol/alkylpyrone synthase
MFLQSISHAVPNAAFTQRECWEILQQSGELNHLSQRSCSLLEKILLGDSAIHKRHFATEDVTRLFSLNAESLNHNFESAAPALAEQALRQALEKANLHARDLSALLICTCTGYLCPGLTSYVAEHLGLSRHAYLQDIVGLGCGAAIPTLRAANGFLSANTEATVACIAVEICSAAFYLDNDPGVLISACLFGDGASASIWSNQAKRTGYRIDHFDTIHVPENRELLRFTNSGGKLRNKLHRSIPRVAAPVVGELFARAGLPAGSTVAAHVGGRDVLSALEETLPAAPLNSSWDVLRDYGNISSPAVLFALEKILNRPDPPKDIWLTAFGAGFAAHACSLKQ